jgi:hypothetical protein|tara:strand:+ start:683 stop:919 length:237 start_codon:yes stop_codon:yes gene_type:complete
LQGEIVLAVAVALDGVVDIEGDVVAQSARSHRVGRFDGGDELRKFGRGGGRHCAGNPKVLLSARFVMIKMMMQFFSRE